MQVTTHFIIGETTLPIACAEILLQNGHKVLGIFSDDKDVIEWAENIGIPIFPPNEGEILTECSKQKFDYLLSIINPVILSE